MIREFISKNMVLKYKIKNLQRKIFLAKMKKKDLQGLMDYDAILFEKRHGYPLDWNNLQTYSEKMQWENFLIKTLEKFYVPINLQ